MKKTIILFLVLSFTICLIPAFAVVSSADDVGSYTYFVPIDSKVKVYFNDSEIFVPTSSGEFKILVNSEKSFGISFSDSFNNILPSFLLESGIDPLSVEFGITFNCTWDKEFGYPDATLIQPSLALVNDYSNLGLGGVYPGGYNMSPQFTDFIQEGIHYESWEKSIYNRDYSVSYRFQCNTESVDSYSGNLSLWLSEFRYSSLNADSLGPYGLEFTISNFYFKFNYYDGRTAQFQDNIQNNPGLGDSAMSWGDYFSQHPIDDFPFASYSINPIIILFDSASDDIFRLFQPWSINSYYITIGNITFEPFRLYLQVVSVVALLMMAISLIKGVRSFRSLS